MISKDYSEFTKYFLSKIGPKLEEVYQREMKEPAYLAQDAFPDCLTRAETAMRIATKEASLDLALVIGHHQEVHHNKDTVEEQQALVDAGADPEVTVMSFWLQ